MTDADVTLDLRGLIRFADRIKGDMSNSTRGPVRDAFKQWAMRWRSFVQQRFDRYSRGGGDWPPLKPATVRRRRKGSSTILRDTNTLFNALDPQWKGRPGALQKDIPFGVRVGYGGPHRHPKGKGVSIADIARFHDAGMGRLPKRQIIVEPDARTRALMAKDMVRALGKVAKGV